MPQVTEPADLDSTEEVQVVVKEFQDSPTGLLAEVYPEENTEAFTAGPLQTESAMYVDDLGSKKAYGSEYIDEVNTWVPTEHPQDLYAFIARTDEDDGYRVEVGEELGHEGTRVLFVAEYTDDELNLEPIPELQEQ